MQLTPEILTQCWFLAGPTACGKTAVGIELAERIGAEILCLDSMTVYRGMDIGTAKATAEEQADCPHHLLDIIEPHEEFSVAEFLTAAQTAAVEIVSRGKIPLFVGGTGLYLRSVLRGVFPGPSADWELRRRLESLAELHGPVWLHERLTSVDPKAAARLHPGDIRRIIRALEVHELTGQPLSDQHRQTALPPEHCPQNVYWLSPQRPWLYERINQRVESMFAAGFLTEVRQLLHLLQPLSRTARQALGYKETLDWLERTGDRHSTHPPPEVIAEIQMRTRQFAKRQHTWFRNLEECQAVELTGHESAPELAQKLTSLVNGAG